MLPSPADEEQQQRQGEEEACWEVEEDDKGDREENRYCTHLFRTSYICISLIMIYKCTARPLPLRLQETR